MLGLQRSVLKVIVNAFSQWIFDRFGASIFKQPGAILFPKIVYEIGSTEPKCPSGASVEYILTAIDKAEEAWDAAESKAKDGHPFERMLRMIQKETMRSLVIERLLLARIQGEYDENRNC